MNSHSTVREERGIPHTTKVIDESAPIFYARKDAPPCLCICGDNDLPGLCEENKKFAETLLAAGHQCCKFKEIPERTHFSIRTNMNFLDDPVVKIMLTFMQEVAISRKSKFAQ